MELISQLYLSTNELTTFRLTSNNIEGCESISGLCRGLFGEVFSE